MKINDLIVGTYCGHTNPPTSLTTGNELYMLFFTDAEGSSTGFSVELSMIQSPCGPLEWFLNDTTPSIEISAPMDGNHYMADMNCLWTISVDDEKWIDVKFEQFDLEGDPKNECTADYLEITDDEVCF